MEFQFSEDMTVRQLAAALAAFAGGQPDGIYPAGVESSEVDGQRRFSVTFIDPAAGPEADTFRPFDWTPRGE